MTENPETEKASIYPLVEFWMSLSRRKILQEHTHEWIKPKPPPLLEEITRRRKEITFPKSKKS